MYPGGPTEDKLNDPLLPTSSYNGYGSGMLPHQEISGSVSMGKTIRFSDNYESFDYKCGLSPVRRMFCLLALFDFLFVFLMWIIYAQLFSTGLEEQFTEEVIHYDFTTSLFDLVVLAFLRTLCLGALYALLKSKRWYMVGITTGVSTVFIIVKVFKVGKSLSHGEPMSYLLMIVSFIICWSEVWHFDFQVIPTELKHAKKHFTSSLPTVVGDANKSYGTWRGRPISEYDQRSFYTANALSAAGWSGSESSESDDSCQTEGSAFSSRSSELKYKQYISQGQEAVHSTMKMLFITDGWKIEKEEKDGIIVLSRDFDDIGKVYKCSAFIDCACDLLDKLLWEDVECQPLWNPGITECRVIAKIDSKTDLCYVLSGEAAGGLIKSRDFVTVRRRRKKGNLFMNCAVSTVTHLMPEKKGIIRAENGPGGFILRGVVDKEERTDFTWFVNSNLKGWIPQKVIDQTMGGVLVDTVRSLRQHVGSLPPLFANGS